MRHLYGTISDRMDAEIVDKPSCYSLEDQGVDVQALYREAKNLMPGGSQLLSKRSEQFLPEQWPAYYSSAKGVEVVSMDGKTYVDMCMMGVGACVLGYADPDVDAAVKSAIDSGSTSTLNCFEEVELSRLLCELHPWADMVRFARSGGEALSIAIRIARASTSRDKVAFCGYHGWCDWYLAANLSSDDALDGHLLPGLSPAGVPRGLVGTAMPFHYNKIEELERIVEECGRDLAAIVMEPMREHGPESDFLQRVRSLADDSGAVLIFDEVSSGFRMNPGGVHLLLGVEPDIAVFAKAMSNGYPMSAVIGKRQVMDAAQLSFISSTNWSERTGPVAALAAIRKYIRCNVSEHLKRIGQRVKSGWQTAADAAGLQIDVLGLPSMCQFSFQCENAAAVSTLFTQMMLDKGFLAWKQFKASYAHEDHHVDEYLEAVQETFYEIRRANSSGQIEDMLRGPIAHNGFHRLT